MRSPLSLALALAAALLTVAASGARAGDAWSHDWKAARARAAAEKKDILIDFNGSDWCGWCQRLTREVFSQEAFLRAGPEHFVLFEVDFVRQPENVQKQPREVRAQNMRLIAEFGVRGFPSIFLADSQGRPYAKTGYQKGGAEPYLAHLAELKKKRDKRDELFARAGEAEGVEKARLLHEALETLEMPVFPFYADVADAILAADPEDTLELKNKLLEQKFQSTVRLASQATSDPAADHDAVLKALDELQAYTGETGEKAQLLLSVRAEVACAQTNPGDPEKRDLKVLLEGFQKAVAAAPDSNLANGPRGLKVAISGLKKRLAGGQ
ncbi:MAG: thioredoxin family protein [Planctomycetes bacterium]|nr:thioredoxin family protein [Planctomycetota bacterium]